MGYTMDQLDDLDALRARDAARNPQTANDMRKAAIDRLRQHSPAPRTTTHLHTTAQATPKMIGYVMVLLRKLDEMGSPVAATARTWWMERAIVDDDSGRVVGSTLTGNKVSDVITRLKGQLADAEKAAQNAAVDVPAPVAPVATPKPAYDAYDDITDGNYALVDDDGKNRFYRIIRKEGKGKYAGRTFINIQERASEELYPVRGSWARKAAILARIRTAGVDASHLLYSTLLKRCWHCHTELTDNTQPYHPFGLGPYCGPKIMG